MKAPRRSLREFWHRLVRGHWPEWWMFDTNRSGCGICHPEATR